MSFDKFENPRKKYFIIQPKVNLKINKMAQINTGTLAH